jgi:hypothetical protein
LCETLRRRGAELKRGRAFAQKSPGEAVAGFVGICGRRAHAVWRGGGRCDVNRLAEQEAPGNGEGRADEEGQQTAGKVVAGLESAAGEDERIGRGGDGEGHGDGATEGDGHDDGSRREGAAGSSGDDEADGEEDVGGSGVAHQV